MTYHQATYDEPLLSEIHSDNRYKVPDADENLMALIPEEIRSAGAKLPEIAEYDVVRHFTRLSQMNYGVDLGIYPLGSCTMKFNPKFADRIASMEEFSETHPLIGDQNIQGSLKIMYDLQRYLSELSDMDAVSLQPLAGAQGEYTGILIIRKYLESIGELEKRKEIIIPDSAHGTNPASAAMAGFDVVEIPSSSDGTVDLEALKSAISDRTAAFMITNPNTLGLFEKRITEIAEIVHGSGALLYYDGANFNAIMGITSPGLMGFDVVHFNLHKTFATPHGGGGPGSGPVGVKKFLSEFLPVPVVEKADDGRYFLNYDLRNTIGKVAPYYGAFSTILRAWAYITYHGYDGLTENTVRAVLNTNYLVKRLQNDFKIPFGTLKKHELVLTTENTGKRALDMAKFLIDLGIHAPTVYFPLNVHEDMMIEPTETVSRRDLDVFADALISASKQDDESLKSHPVNLSVGRIDEVKAARQLKLHW
ncbi:MAG: aminomethyl-transferring glycine dehydrogenase subunit GcvPB [Candidatus Thermoplasmatota archaeon]|nr:aminomethyl-transferring glycine dehydrogenase subunit GcvPB [Candidatus Thermoplasmatota archaeon]